jgi:hypothetical protein
LHESLHRLSARLEAEKIAYALVGGMALGEHGYGGSRAPMLSRYLLLHAAAPLRPDRHRGDPYYHVVSRGVRRAFLCGYDRCSQKTFDHRKTWLLEKLAVLSTKPPFSPA